ncbi:M13 family metallopeptidase N-terminal domain-containing protein [Austwickia sp. TVS 96-490-7B]|uniref:M13 family metallopeptidase N-terminal domain-containing protein n=1 Tax=Austwickia sp. TVS 96-490-7B TaxID=2830843 RepID=UPI002105D3DF|nr:M13 family metallopeptidase N-terminal domain-containing protein [Austwickia sp. TVS 96-490-7B]
MVPVEELSARVSPRDDLWGWVNDSWAASDPIPADRARYGLSDAKRAQVAAELAAIVRDQDAPCAVATLNRLWTDTTTRDRVGIEPVRDELDAAAAVAGPDDVLIAWGCLQRDGVTGPFEVHVLPREDDPTRWQVSLFQAGTTLPPRLHARHRDDLATHARALHAAAGLPVGDADAALRVEDALVAVAWADPEGDSDEALHHPHPWTDLASTACALGLDLGGYAQGLSVPDVALTPRFVWNLCQPSYAAGLGRLLDELPLKDWRAFLRWRVLADRAHLLTTELDDLATRFRDCTVAGQSEPTPAWRRAVAGVQANLPMDLAHAWVQAHVDPARRCPTRPRARRRCGPWTGGRPRALPAPTPEPSW